jgi:phosphatidylglycerophosphate synthase
MIGERWGHIFDKPLGNVARRIPLHPNVITVVGFVVTLIASGVLVSDLRLGGVLVLAGGFFDACDGVVARARGRSSAFGAYLDSVLDRYSDAAILIAVAAHMERNTDMTGMALALTSLVGAFLISYARARAEGLGVDCKNGLMERPERLILICFGAISGLMTPVLWALAILTHLTVLQRMRHVWKVTSDGVADDRPGL